MCKAANCTAQDPTAMNVELLKRYTSHPSSPYNDMKYWEKGNCTSFRTKKTEPALRWLEQGFISFKLKQAVLRPTGFVIIDDYDDCLSLLDKIMSKKE